MTRLARLIYDSAREGDLLGTRGGFGVERMLLYRAPGVSVDVVLPLAGQQVHYLHGQVTDEQQALPLSGVSVRVGDAPDAVRTDEFGQFALGIPGPDGASVVRIEGPGGPIDCIIPDPGSAGAR